MNGEVKHIKDEELDGTAGEVSRVVKRSGVFDAIKKSSLDELQQLVSLRRPY